MTLLHRPKVLLVSEEDQPCGATIDLLQDRGFGVGLARNGRQAVEAVRCDRTIDLLVSAMDLADLDGITLAQLAQCHRPRLDILLLCTDPQELRTAARFGLHGLKEPVQPDVLAAAARGILSAHRAVDFYRAIDSGADLLRARSIASTIMRPASSGPTQLTTETHFPFSRSL